MLMNHKNSIFEIYERTPKSTITKM